MRNVLVSLVVLTLLASASVIYAHPPSDIKITFDPQTKMLNAVISHNTNNPTSHYVKQVDILLNGRKIIEHNISKEDNNLTQTVSYLIPDAKEGDKISVEGHCSISGQLKKEITVKLK
ncbi:MAG: hypothetical protein PHW62_07130 [Candidatus Ratteibacteria bacterium]|nr:hypothetical protein [Candidatus Ratteibacteria bacterium]